MAQVDADSTSLQDPADRPRTLSDQQKQKIIENGPYQQKVEALSRKPRHLNKNTVYIFKRVV